MYTASLNGNTEIRMAIAGSAPPALVAMYCIGLQDATVNVLVVKVNRYGEPQTGIVSNDERTSRGGLSRLGVALLSAYCSCKRLHLSSNAICVHTHTCIPISYTRTHSKSATLTQVQVHACIHGYRCRYASKSETHAHVTQQGCMMVLRCLSSVADNDAADHINRCAEAD